MRKVYNWSNFERVEVDVRDVRENLNFVKCQQQLKCFKDKKKQMNRRILTDWAGLHSSTRWRCSQLLQSLWRFPSTLWLTNWNLIVQKDLSGIFLQTRMNKWTKEQTLRLLSLFSLILLIVCGCLFLMNNSVTFVVDINMNPLVQTAPLVLQKLNQTEREGPVCG